MTGTAESEPYYEYFRDKGSTIISLLDLFTAVDETPQVSQTFDSIVQQASPISVLVEGSAFVQNLDVVADRLHERGNPADRILLVDINDQSTTQHADHIRGRYPQLHIDIVQGNMNTLPLPDGSVDIVINDCAINFNQTAEQNNVTMREIARVLKPNRSLALFSVAVDKRYDQAEYGENQELVPESDVDTPGFFRPIPQSDIQRKCWSVPYYVKTIELAGLSWQEFDREKGKTYFAQSLPTISFRRFALQKPDGTVEFRGNA